MSEAEDLLRYGDGYLPHGTAGCCCSSATCSTTRASRQCRGRALSQSANAATMQQQLMAVRRINGGGSECSLDFLQLEDPPASGFLPDVVPCTDCLRHGDAATPLETCWHCVREGRGSHTISASSSTSPREPCLAITGLALRGSSVPAAAAAAGSQMNAGCAVHLLEEGSMPFAPAGSSSCDASTFRWTSASVTVPATQFCTPGSLSQLSSPIDDASSKTVDVSSEDSSLHQSAQKPLPPRRPHHLPLQQQQPWALHQSLDQSWSCDCSSEPRPDANMPVSARKGLHIRTVSDPKSLDSSAFFRPIESANSRQQPTIESAEITAHDSTTKAVQPTVAGSPVTDLVAGHSRLVDDSGSSGHGGSEPVDHSLSTVQLATGKLGYERLPPNCSASCLLPSPGHVRTPTALRYRPSVVQHRVWEEEEEEEQVVEQAVTPLSGHAEASPLWHSWSGRELSSRLRGGSSSNLHVASTALGRELATSTTDEVFLSSTAATVGGALATSHGTVVADGDGRGPAATEAAPTCALRGSESVGRLCFATYKPPLSTAVAARSGVGPTASLRRAMLRSSSTSGSDHGRHELGPAALSSPSSSSSSLSLSLRARQHGSVDCIDRLAMSDAAAAPPQAPAKRRPRPQLLWGQGGAAECAAPGSMTSAAAAAAVSPGKSAAGVARRNAAAGIDCASGGPPPLEGALTAAVRGTSGGWYTSQGGGDRGGLGVDGISGAAPVPVRTSSHACVDFEALEQRLLLEGLAVSAAATAVAAKATSSSNLLASRSGAIGTAPASSGGGAALLTPDSIVSASGKFDRLFGWSDYPSPTAAAAPTAEGAAAPGESSNSLECHLVPAPAGAVPRPRRPVPRTNPHVFHKNSSSSSSGGCAGAGEDTVAVGPQMAARRYLGRVLSDSCLVWPKAIPLPSPTLPSTAPYHPASTAALLTGMLGSRRSVAESGYDRVMPACLEGREAVPREQLGHAGCSTVCAEGALRLAHRLEGETLV